MTRWKNSASTSAMCPSPQPGSLPVMPARSLGRMPSVGNTRCGWLLSGPSGNHSTIGLVSLPLFLMSAPSARSSSGAMSGNSSAAGWIGRTSRQPFKGVDSPRGFELPARRLLQLTLVRLSHDEAGVLLRGVDLLLRSAPCGCVFEGNVSPRADRCFARSAPLRFQLEEHADGEPMSFAELADRVPSGGHRWPADRRSLSLGTRIRLALDRRLYRRCIRDRWSGPPLRFIGCLCRFLPGDFSARHDRTLHETSWRTVHAKVKIGVTR